MADTNLQNIGFKIKRETLRLYNRYKNRFFAKKQNKISIEKKNELLAASSAETLLVGKNSTPEVNKQEILLDLIQNILTPIFSFDEDIIWDRSANNTDRLLLNNETDHINNFENGILLNGFKAGSGGLVKISLTTNSEANLKVRCFSTLTKGQYGITEYLKNGNLNFITFIPREEEFSIEITCTNPTTIHWTLKSIDISQIDPNLYYTELKNRQNYYRCASIASIPTRQTMLKDCIESLIFQVDRIYVFLNNYETVPEFLKHERIEVARSQDWEDLGDLGKFFWADRITNSGYRFFVDDDLIYAPDYIERMIEHAKKYENRAIVGCHGILLRQPIEKFHDRNSRALTCHFAYKNIERFVQILGTGVMCYHSSLVNIKPHDLLYKNSADIWLALYAQSHSIPMISIERPDNWIIENKRDGKIETIFDNSLKNSSNAFNSARVQNSALKHAFPLKVNSLFCPKIAFCLFTNDQSKLDKLAAFVNIFEKNSDIVLNVAIISKDAELLNNARSTNIPFATYLINSDTDNIEKILSDLCCDAYMYINDIDALLSFKYINELISDFIKKIEAGNFVLATKDNRSDLLFTLYRGLQNAGENYPFLYESLSEFYQNTNKIQNSIKKFPFKLSGKYQEFKFFYKNKPKENSIFNAFFERVVYLNLSHRPDRKKRIDAELSRHNIVAQRFEAVNGQDPDVEAEYKQYLTKPLAVPPNNIKKVQGTIDFYIRSKSQGARLGWIEQKHNRKAIGSKGAWAYLKGWEKILEQAIDDGIETLLILDDDTILNHDAANIFERAIADLPDDWLVLQLGTFQYNWYEPWAEWLTPFLYKSNGHCVGSHAVGLRFDAMIYILNQIKLMDLPLDVGPLSSISREFPKQCFITYPHIAIQSLLDTDIGTSGYQDKQINLELYQKYNWDISQYGVAPYNAPDYVKHAIETSLTCQPTLIKKQRNGFIENSPILLCVLKNEEVILPDFMRHYRKLGVKNFIFIDNNSDDNTFEYLKALPDVTLYQVKEKFNWMDKQGWITNIINQYGYDNWYLYVDADELLVYDGYENHNIDDLVTYLEEQGSTRVRGMLIDMYSDDILLNTKYDGKKLIDNYSYFDASGYVDDNYIQLISRKGGVRKRKLCHNSTVNPQLTKYPLFKLEEGEIFANPHHLWPYEKNFNQKCYLGLLHFKFLPGLIEHLDDAVSKSLYWQGSVEYEAYLSALQEDPDLCLKDENSELFNSPEDLINANLIERIFS